MKRPTSPRSRKAANTNLTPLKSMLFEWAERDHGLRGNPANFLSALARHGHHSNGTVWICRKQFAKAIKASPRSITSFTSRLQKMGLIAPIGTKTRAGFKIYRLAPGVADIEADIAANRDKPSGNIGTSRGNSCATYKDSTNSYFNKGAEPRNSDPDRERSFTRDDVRAQKAQPQACKDIALEDVENELPAQINADILRRYGLRPYASYFSNAGWRPEGVVVCRIASAAQKLNTEYREFMADWDIRAVAPVRESSNG